MSTTVFLAGLSFDPSSASFSQNFLAYLNQPSKPYTIFSNTVDEWIVQVNSPGTLGFTYVAFYPDTSFVPGPTSTKTPPLGDVWAVVLYNASGQAVGYFEDIEALGFSVEELLSDPGRLVQGIEDFFGSASSDTLHAGAGDDYLTSFEGNDFMYGDAGDDYIDGGEGADLINGGDGDDYLEDGLEDTTVFVDTINGGAGDDHIVTYGGADIINGGDGVDWIEVDRTDLTSTFNLTIGSNGSGAASDGTAITNAEVVWVFSGSGNDTIGVGEGGGFADGGAGNDTLSGGGGEDGLAGGDGNDTLVGWAGNDILIGEAGDDWMVGGLGDDTFAGGEAGTNVMQGGEGLDVVVYSNTGGVWVDLAAGVYSASGVWDAFFDIEGLVGDAGADTLFGTSGANSLWGEGGNDTLIGRQGSDDLYGAGGDDWLDGGEGDDVLEGNGGVNVLIGGAGTDLASYASATGALWINMAAGVYSASGVWDVFFDSIDGVRGGSGNDSIFGNTSANVLEGGLGDDALVGDLGNDTLRGENGSDWLVGGDGDDRLVGGGGVDVLTGGAGADIFDLGTEAGWDVAFDFNTAQDRFQLGGLQWLGFVTIDADGDGQTDDTLLGYAGGNFVALNVSGLSLSQWNALVDAPTAAIDAEKGYDQPDPEVLPVSGGPLVARGSGFSFDPGLDAATRGFRAEDPFLVPQDDWGPVAA